MDKAAMLRAFKTMLANASGIVMSEKCKLCAVAMAGLKKMDIMDAYIASRRLNKEICYEGRVMYAKICNSAAVVGNNMVLCLVEQEDDDGAAFLHIFNALTSASKQEDAEVMFPVDATVAIKEPLCFSSNLHVSSPASVEFLGLTRPLRQKLAETLVKEANLLLARGKFVLAELYYTEVLNKREPACYNALEKEALSNRSEARLRLGRYEEAIMDAEAALNIPDEKHHWKILWCKGMGLTALQEHKQAFSCFRESAALQPDAPSDVRKDLEKCKTCLTQSIHGKYDIVDYVLGRKAEPNCSDYFGPLELRMTSDGRGRGIYLTKDVKVGELLIVCNPVAYAKSVTRENADRDLFVELIRACVTSERRFYHVHAMADASDMKTVPDVNRFKCNIGSVVPREENQRVDLRRIKRVSHRCGFTSMAGDLWLSGVWSSIGFFNHSCIPNASKVCFGKVMFIRATRDMKAGDEVLLSYMESTSHTDSALLAPLSTREKKCKQLDFECGCRRCMLERENTGMLSDLSYNWNDASAMEELQKKAVELEKRMNRRCFTEEEKDCIRVGFADLYCAAFVSDQHHPELPSAESYLRILHETAPGNFETLLKMSILYNGCGGGPKTLELLRKEVVGLFGDLSMEVLDEVINRFKAFVT